LTRWTTMAVLTQPKKRLSHKYRLYAGIFGDIEFACCVLVFGVIESLSL
jgi:hypothetical protein